MKTRAVIASLGVTGVVGGSLALLSPSASARTINIGDGAASVTIAQCNDKGSPQAVKFVEGCSYTALMNTRGTVVNYTFVASDGAITWKEGTVNAGAMDFPAANQTWPPITGLTLSTVSTSTPSDITGTVNLATGKVTLNLKVNTLLDSPTLGKCTLTGEVTVTSEGTESFSKTATGSNYDPATGKFAVVTTTPGTIQTSDSGTACKTLGNLYDIKGGMGYYLTGTIALPGGATPTPEPPTPTPDPTPEPEPTDRKKQKPLKALNLPSKLANSGVTRIVKLPVRTNAGQNARVRVTGTPIDAGAAGEVRPFRTYKRAGAVWVNLSGTQATRVRVQLRAPETTNYTAYSKVKVYRTKAVR
jgi:hypothetical protein